MLHASAFGLYAVSTVINFIVFLVCCIIYLGCLNKPCFDTTLVNARIAAFSAVIFASICYFFSQILLSVIFIQLNSKDDKEELAENKNKANSRDDSRDISVTVEPFDEEAEVMAQVWNAFSRRIHGVDSLIKSGVEQDVSFSQSNLLESNRSAKNKQLDTSMEGEDEEKEETNKHSIIQMSDSDAFTVVKDSVDSEEGLFDYNKV